ncbi:hypothetical protein ABT063_46370 [Streptomyces sp. NPDC002838]
MFRSLGHTAGQQALRINDCGNAWENQAVFDPNGRTNPNIRWLP